jgi:phage FluMu gp28-like protein
MASNDAIALYDYQKRWLADSSRFKIGMFARQCGKTFTATLEIVLDCLEAESQGKKRRWVILSRGERQAKEAMDEGVKKHLAAMKIVFEALEFDFDYHTKALEVTLPGGSRITALPANPDTARGFSANVLLDEFAFHADSRAIWQALFPVISAGHKLRVISTPNGKGNKFFELMSSAALSATWSRHQCDIHQAVAAGLPRDIDALRSGIGDMDAWAQEYELQFLDEAHAFLPFELIDAATDAGAGKPDAFIGRPCYLGVDIAARNDLYVQVVLEPVGDVLWAREIIALSGVSFAMQDHLFDTAMRTFKVARAAIDQTGMGEKPVEDAVRRYGSRVQGVLFSAAKKLDLATALKEAMQDRRLRIPDDRLLRFDLHAVKKVPGVTGAPRLVADGDTDGHADRFWALALAVGAAVDGAAAVCEGFRSARDTPAARRGPGLRGGFDLNFGGDDGRDFSRRAF